MKTEPQRSEQEWTPKQIAEKLTCGKTQLVAEIEDLTKQLTAERQLVQWCEVHAPTKDEPITCCPCCEAAHERQRGEELQHELAAQKVIAVAAIKSHLSALAAIEKINKLTLDYVRADLALQQIRIWSHDVDLFLLREHDEANRQEWLKSVDALIAEVRKPLVDALKELRTWTDAHDHERVIIDDALAKVNQTTGT